jgi:hypothetical protein
LNPIRAGIAGSPEDSAFTSIMQRIQQLRGTTSELALPLRVLRNNAHPRPNAIPFHLRDYLELVEWTGRTVRADKPGAIDARLPPILARLNVDRTAWRHAMRPRGNVFGRAMGRLSHLRLHARTLGQSWVRGIQHAQRLFAT